MAFAVLDLNVLRNQRIVEACITRFRQHGEHIAIPELALFELTKHADKWEPTVLGSFRLLAQCPDSVMLTRSTKPLGLREEATGISTVTVIDAELTGELRALLRDIAVGGGPNLEAFRCAVESYRGVFDHQAHADDSLRSVQNLKALASTTLPPKLVAQVGTALSRDDRTSFRDLLRECLTIREQRNAHIRRGVSVDAADGLLKAPSMSYLFAQAFGAIGLEWYFRGGIEAAAPGRVANDILDIEYILAGFWIGRLISEDRRLRDRFDDLKVLGTSAWPSHAEWFGRAQVLAPDEALATLSNN